MKVLGENHTDPAGLVWGEPQFPANPLLVTRLSVNGYGGELHFG